MDTTNQPSCNTASLNPYSPTGQNPWNTTKVKHAFRRLGFGANLIEIDDALALSPGAFIDSLVDAAVALPLTPAPFWGNFAISDFTNYTAQNEQYIFDWRLQSGNDIISEKLRGRLAFFWMNHFVTELETVFYSPFLFQYYRKMQSFALGNFREFTREMGSDNMMLLYLNGFENTNVNPNENYARELFELFTLGEGNEYTEQDIVETSRALTGYNHWSEPGADIYFDASTFDNGTKEIFGQSGTWGYDDVIDILFDQKGDFVARFICEKLYKFFVSPEVDEIIRQDIIAPLAQTLVASDFEMAPMLKQLFKSEHFFDERALGVVVKSPIDVIFNYVNEASFFYDDTLMEAFLNYAGLVGQEIYDPPDVSGWQRDETWINASTLTGRWGLLSLYIDFLFVNGYESLLVDLARNLSNDSNDPAFITEVVIDHFMSKGLHTASDYTVATDIFKWEVPQNYYDEGLWNLNWSSAPLQVSLLLKHIAQMPEFQLK